jgi:hypothetical protein
MKKMIMLMHDIYFVNFQVSWGVQTEVLVDKNDLLAKRQKAKQ